MLGMLLPPPHSLFRWLAVDDPFIVQFLFCVKSVAAKPLVWFIYCYAISVNKFITAKHYKFLMLTV